MVSFFLEKRLNFAILIVNEGFSGPYPGSFGISPNIHFFTPISAGRKVF